MVPLEQLGENAVLQRLLACLPPAPGDVTAAGDDCAVVPRNEAWDTLLKVDAVVENVHFLPDTGPRLIGRKALARAVSDIAAMGGLPEHALVTLLVHPSRPVELLEGIYTGMAELAALYGVTIAGGETTSLPQDGLAINIALTGRVEKGQAILRSTGKPGDIICVTGPLGGSFPSGRHLTFQPRVELARRLMNPDFRPSAMMDLSDGLGTDLPRLAAACSCGFDLQQDSIPCNPGRSTSQAIGDGEDYELLLTIPPSRFGAAVAAGIRLYPIGHLVSGCGTELPEGWQHFRAEH